MTPTPKLGVGPAIRLTILYHPPSFCAVLANGSTIFYLFCHLTFVILPHPYLYPIALYPPIRYLTPLRVLPPCELRV